MNTPWGESQTVETIADGIINVTTASHGGIKLSDERVRQLKAKFPGYKTFRGFDCWFEEDCDWAIVAYAFPEYFLPEHVEIAKNILLRFHKEIEVV